MNQHRIEGNFEIRTLPAFRMVVELLTEVVETAVAQQDMAIARSCIILSQTFYRLKNGTKYFIQSKLMHHTLWQQPDFWKSLIRQTIAEELVQLVSITEERQL
jgi:hypothetical protein